MLYHIATHVRGSSRYNDAHKRGTVDVWHDSKRYIYHKPADRARFKAELALAFTPRGGVPPRIHGSYPHYSID